MIDLRSDTITKPTGAMREVMWRANVGDDVLGDDPTVRALEERTAEILGKAAAVYMPSGTMTNQVAIRSHTEPGDEVIMEAEGHSYLYEAGGPGALAGVMCRLIPGERGVFTAEAVRAVLRPKDYHFAPSRLICIENTHNRGGGAIWPLEKIADIAGVAKEAKLKMHLDGARLWNASVATGIAERDYARYFDSVSVCFSKGLGAPVGSALAGTAEFIDRARRFRKQFGGGMRQAGIIAAGALYALENHRERLAEDHAHARKLAAGIAELPGIELNPDHVETNIIYFKITSQSPEELAQTLYQEGVYVLASGPHRIRAVTSLEVSAAQINQAIEIFARVLRK